MPKGFTRGGGAASKQRQAKGTSRSLYGFELGLIPGIASFAFRTGRRSGLADPDKNQPFPDPPMSWLGTLPEWAIYWAHLSLGRKPDEDFQYQYVLDPGMVL